MDRKKNLTALCPKHLAMGATQKRIIRDAFNSRHVVTIFSNIIYCYKNTAFKQFTLFVTKNKFGNFLIYI